jgi:hypothetical protein
MILPMARRMLAWLLITPLAAVGVLAAHAAAYAATGASLGEEHGYLDHAPQVAGLLSSLALVGLALQERSLRPRSVWWFAPIAPLGFTCQEHLERLVHTGQLPFLLTSPTFLVGLALQLPVAAVCFVLVRRIVGTLPGAQRRSRAEPRGAWLPLTDTPPLVVRSAWRTPRRGRGPPALRVA